MSADVPRFGLRINSVSSAIVFNKNLVKNLMKIVIFCMFTVIFLT